jgi:hypothetical protein
VGLTERLATVTRRRRYWVHDTSTDTALHALAGHSLDDYGDL